MYLIIRNNKMNQVLQEYLWREWGENPPDCITRIVSRCIVHVCRAGIIPLVVHNCLVVLLSVTLAKMVLEV